MATTTVVLVPGGFTGAWMWADVVAELQRVGIPAVALELPTIGELGVEADLHADARAVREVLDRLASPVLLCGHSYGGAVITEAAAGPHPSVRHLVYLTAAVPDSGQSLVDLMSGDTSSASEGEGVRWRADGLAELDRDQARRALFNDCSPQRADAGLDRLRPAALTGGSQPLSSAAWRHVRATYIRGSQDLMPEAIAPAFLETGPTIIDLPVGHCGHWSRPDLVAGHLAACARSLEAR